LIKTSILILFETKKKKEKENKHKKLAEKQGKPVVGRKVWKQKIEKRKLGSSGARTEAFVISKYGQIGIVTCDKSLFQAI